MGSWDGTCRGSGVVRKSGMIAKEQGHRVLRGWGTERILGLGVVGASSKNRGEMPLVQALTTRERDLWRDEVESRRPLGRSAVEAGAG